MAIAAQRKDSFNLTVNGFRGLCVLFVFAYHVINSGLIEVPVDPSMSTQALLFFASSWRYGVELFFMISGFVIVNSLLRHRTLSDFLTDRCIRIFPVWIPVHLCIFVFAAALGWKYFSNASITQSITVFIANLLLLPPLVPIPVMHPASWSLSYEWLFYLLAAAASALALRLQGAKQLRIAGWMLWSVVTISALVLLPRALFFIPGVIIALNWLSVEKFRPVLRLPLVSLLIFLLAWRMVGFNEARPTLSAIDSVMSWSGIFYSLLAFVAGLHLFACVCTGAGATRWLNRHYMQLLGNVSYSFYLWHPIVMFAVKKLVTMWLLPHVGWVLSVVVFAIMSFILALLLSRMSYVFIEQGIAKRLRAAANKRAAAIDPKSATQPALRQSVAIANSEGSRI